MFGKSIKDALSYNEDKIRKNDAELILASRFACEIPELSFTEKLSRFQKIIKMNKKIENNAAHIIVSFSPHDILDNEKLQNIAFDLMNRIGFENQPYLVYLHSDTNITHLHIVSTTIRPDGSGIYLHNFGKRISTPVRKQLEIEYGLLPAEAMNNHKEFQYSETSVKAYITNTIRDVVSNFHFTSINELNTILKTKNIRADIGLPGSRMFEYGGLVYYKLNKFGKREGAPIKASSIYTAPTLLNLRKKFNDSSCDLSKKTNRTEKILNHILNFATPIDFPTLFNTLNNNNIYCSIVNLNNSINEIIFYDKVNKAAFSNKILALPIDAILNRITISQDAITPLESTSASISDQRHSTSEFRMSSIASKLIDDLLLNDYSGADLSPVLFRKKKRKKKRTI